MARFAVGVASKLLHMSVKVLYVLPVTWCCTRQVSVHIILAREKMQLATASRNYEVVSCHANNPVVFICMPVTVLGGCLGCLSTSLTGYNSYSPLSQILEPPLCEATPIAAVKILRHK